MYQTQVHTHTQKEYIYYLARGKSVKLENQNLGTMFGRKSRLNQKGVETREKNIIHRKEMCRLKPHFSSIEAFQPLQRRRALAMRRAEADFEFQLEKYNNLSLVCIEQ